MPITKKLHDVVELLGEHDVIYQDMAVKKLVRILDMAEEAISESHLSREERHAEQQERMLAFIERRGGKAKADALRKRLDAIKRAVDRGDLDDLDD
jgi:hypothetical protein